MCMGLMSQHPHFTATSSQFSLCYIDYMLHLILIALNSNRELDLTPYIRVRIYLFWGRLSRDGFRLAEG